MNISDFLKQRSIVNYNQKEHLANLHQFLFFMREVKFSDEELLKTSPCFERIPHYIANDNLTFYIPQNKNADQYFSHNQMASELKVHIGTEAIRAVRDSFSAIYPFYKLKKNSTQEEVAKIKEYIHNITYNFFEIMKYVSHLNLPNIPTFIPNGHFGSNIVAHYHESLALLAMHNYSQFNIEEYSDLIDKIIPDNSLSNPKFLALFTSILYNDEQSALMDTLFRKIDNKQFTLASLNQTKNHKNFFIGLKKLVQDPNHYLSHFSEKEHENFVKNLFSNLSMIGMINNGYYVKSFSKEDKLALSKFIEALPNNNNIIYDLATTHRFQNIDFEALVSNNIIFNSKLITVILIHSNSQKKNNISYLLQYLAKDELISFHDIGQHLASLSDASLSNTLDLIRNNFSQKSILNMMNSNVHLFNKLEPLYREKNLQRTLSEKNKNEPIKAKSKI